MEKELRDLLSVLCVEQGFCIPPESARKIIESKTLEADGFACAVIKAEGMHPDDDIYWRRIIRNAFIDKFGCNEISQNDFKNT